HHCLSNRLWWLTVAKNRARPGCHRDRAEADELHQMPALNATELSQFDAPRIISVAANGTPNPRIWFRLRRGSLCSVILGVPVAVHPGVLMLDEGFWAEVKIAG